MLGELLERFPDEASYEAVKDAFVIDNKVLKGAKTNMIVMHPLPRNNEIHEEVDFDPRAAYFRQVSFRSQDDTTILTTSQMRYGLYTRMALLAMVMAN